MTREPNSSALRHDADLACRREGGAEGRVEMYCWIGVDDADAVWPNQPDAGSPTDVQQLCLAAHALGSGLRKAGGHHDHRRDALDRALPCDLDDRRSRHANDGKIDGAWDIAYRFERAYPLDRPAGAVDGVSNPGKAPTDVGEDSSANGRGVPRSPDDSHRLRFEEVADGGDDRGPLTVPESRQGIG